MTNDPIAALEQARAVRLNPSASVAHLRDAAAQAPGAVRALDAGKRLAPHA